MTDTTSFSNKCSILAQLWMNHRQDPEFQDFVEYNDLGLPLAYAIAENVVSAKELATQFINETWDVLLAGLNTEDTGFETLDDLLSKPETDTIGE
jgi:hypothetical protein